MDANGLLKAIGAEEMRVDRQDYRGETTLRLYAPITKKDMGTIRIRADGRVEGDTRAKEVFPKLGELAPTPEPPAPKGEEKITFDARAPKHGNMQAHTYLARLAGPHARFGFDRAFVEPTEVSRNGRDYTFHADAPGVYELQDGAGRKYFQVSRAEGGLTHKEISAEEAKQAVGHGAPAEQRPAPAPQEAPEKPAEPQAFEYTPAMREMADRAIAAGVTQAQIDGLLAAYPAMRQEAWWQHNARSDSAHAIRHRLQLLESDAFKRRAAKWTAAELMAEVRAHRAGRAADNDKLSEAAARGLIGMSEAMNRDY